MECCPGHRNQGTTRPFQLLAGGWQVEAAGLVERLVIVTDCRYSQNKHEQLQIDEQAHSPTFSEIHSWKYTGNYSRLMIPYETDERVTWSSTSRLVREGVCGAISQVALRLFVEWKE